MSSQLDEQMKPKEIRLTLADRVSETLSLFHDFEPLQPTKKKIEYMRKDDIESYPEDERDISMLTNMDSNMVYLSALSKSLDVTHPCESRTAFMEQLMRSSRSKDGWGMKMAIEGMKAIRPTSEEETEQGRIRRFTDWIRGKKS